MRNASINLLAAAILLQIAGCSPDGLTFADPWIPAAPPNVGTLAGYVEVRNGTDQPLVIVRATSPAFEEVTFHRTETDEGLVRMIEVPDLPLPPGGSFALKPGGYHLMLIAPRQPLRAGDNVEVTLAAADGRRFDVTFEVRRMNFLL
ncbi:MAG: copper chaperone PCu(A)C [Proteobacteria bacterium]|nr:MAG: copper chaperone PCu(A)C [Pseudomonadota bacterium]